MSSTTTNLVFLIKRQPHLTFSDFKLQYENHVKLATPVILKYGAVYYSVQFNRPKPKDDLQDTLKNDEKVVEGIMIEYDAITTMRFRESDEFKKAWESEEQRGILSPDAARFMGEMRFSFWTEALGIIDGESMV
ncbi:uncharacterized protein PAC_01732 [Phialocephala subalpina]|uniref:EthD domain-containing protein n=1 Tax=Phialocephala subalpina TaxID=576137 RepID=A0A1L7WGG0_9HELO|nr:uncharacterized protein PAC_01732 [Phialocephala subalpina]